MSPHLKLHMETFSYFLRWVYFLILTFYQGNKTETKNPSKNVEAVGWNIYRVSEILAHIWKGGDKFCKENCTEINAKLAGGFPSPTHAWMWKTKLTV